MPSPFYEERIMANETAQAVEAASRDVSGLFDQAFRAYGDSLKVAMKAQEETVRFWGETVGKANPMPTLAGELIPAAQKNTDEYLRLLESSYRRGAFLLKKVIPSQNAGEGIDLQQRTPDWWEASIEVARDNAQDWANTNLRVAQSWTEMFKKSDQKMKGTVGSCQGAAATASPSAMKEEMAPLAK
jgi:hypothetical protein